MIYTVYVHNNRPLYEGYSLKEALVWFEAGVDRVRSGLLPAEKIELCGSEAVLVLYDPETDESEWRVP